MTGLGGNSCGQGPPLESGRVKASARFLAFIIRPIVSKDWKEKTAVVPAGEMPLSIFRDRRGEVYLHTENKDAVVLFQVNGEAVQAYRDPFLFREEGEIVAWYEGKEDAKYRATFPKIEIVPLSVVSASCEETGGGRAQNLVDGQLNTIWHTMYSVTVAQYPHWVDFDAGEIKNIKGFSYVPRQDGGVNGNIKGYRLQISADGQSWSNPIAEGEFGNDGKTQTIRLQSPVKGRYVRFTALSSQNGQDFASGAEFALLADEL